MFVFIMQQFYLQVCFLNYRTNYISIRIFISDWNERSLVYTQQIFASYWSELDWKKIALLVALSAFSTQHRFI